MTKKLLPLIAMGLLSGNLLLAAPLIPSQDIQQPQALPILEFVAAIELGAYSSFNLAPVSDYAPLDFATALYITQPFASVNYAAANQGSLEGYLITTLEAFNNYWILSGPNADLFTTSPLGVYGIDTPQIDAHYIANALNESEQTRHVQAPEMNANGGTGALTLLAGAILVLLGRRRVF